jgi:hypothetical protein
MNIWLFLLEKFIKNDFFEFQNKSKQGAHCNPNK